MRRDLCFMVWAFRHNFLCLYLRDAVLSVSLYIIPRSLAAMSRILSVLIDMYDTSYGKVSINNN